MNSWIIIRQFNNFHSSLIIMVRITNVSNLTLDALRIGYSSDIKLISIMQIF